MCKWFRDAKWFLNVNDHWIATAVKRFQIKKKQFLGWHKFKSSVTFDDTNYELWGLSQGSHFFWTLSLHAHDKSIDKDDEWFLSVIKVFASSDSSPQGALNGKQLPVGNVVVSVNNKYKIFLGNCLRGESPKTSKLLLSFQFVD
jgi:hypothetical protein